MDLKRIFNKFRRKRYLHLIKIKSKSANSIEFIKNTINEIKKYRNPKISMPRIYFECEPIYDLSVIVPIYNVELYLEDCLNSIVSQNCSYKFEIICINDGSSDASSNILEKFAKLHMIEIINQDNHGLGNARNVGIRHAKGKYIMFVDSDDILPQNSIRVLMDGIIEKKLDCLVGASNVYNYKQKIKSRKNRIKIAKTKEDAWKYGKGVFWGRIYKREIFTKFANLEGCLYEDAVNSIILPQITQKIGYCSSIVYSYRRRENSIMSSIGKKQDYRVFDSVLLMEFLSKYMKEKKCVIDSVIYKAFLDQLNGAVVFRIKYEDEYLKKCAFLACYQILKDIKKQLADSEHKKLLKGDLIFEEILLNLKYDAWRV